MAQTRMRPFPVVFDPPPLDLVARVGERDCRPRTDSHAAPPDLAGRGIARVLPPEEHLGRAAGPDADEPGDIFTCAVEGFVFEVDVQGFDVVVYRRGPRG